MLLTIWASSFVSARVPEKIDPVLETARALRASGNNEAALTEYLRYLFFHPTAENISDVYFEMGKTYLQLNQWDRAKEALRQSVKLAPDDSVKNVRRIDLAIQSIAHKNYSLAVLELLKVATFGRQPGLRHKAQFYLGTAEVYLLEFGQAEVAFRNYFAGDSSEAAQKTRARLANLLKKGLSVRPRSPRTARWLSTFVPGLGQLYAGDLKNALNAFALNGAIGYGVAQALVQKNYIDATLEGAFLFQRYYLGNRFRAAQIAGTHHLRKKRQIAQDILLILNGYLLQ